MWHCLSDSSKWFSSLESLILRFDHSLHNYYRLDLFHFFLQRIMLLLLCCSEVMRIVHIFVLMSSNMFNDEDLWSLLQYNIFFVSQVPIPQLKEQIAGITGVISEQQRLICRGKVLKDDEILSAYRILLCHLDVLSLLTNLNILEWVNTYPFWMRQ